MKHLGRDGWVKLISELDSSGLSHKEFAAQHGVTLSTLQFWKYKLRRESRLDSTPALLPVKVVGSAAPSARLETDETVELTLPSGIRLRIPSKADVRYVAELVRALG